MAQWYEVALFALEEFGVQVQILVGLLQFRFFLEFSEQILLETDWFCVYLTSVFIIFLNRDILICSFNNNMLEKLANDKAFNIMASAQLFTT